jgi:hypothetical protein
VTGENFHPSLATGTRPPLSGKPSGTYVTFGKFADAWRPSTGAPSSNRKTATAASGGLKWAVLAGDLTTIGGASAGGIELSPSGAFTAELTIDKAALDAIATDPVLTKYGIYTYPGSGGVAPAYETYTPLSFETTPVVKSKTQTRAGWHTKPTRTTAGIVVVKVYPTPSVPKATGNVKLTMWQASKPSKVYSGATKKLSAGQTWFVLPKTLRGAWVFRATYQGSSTHAGSTWAWSWNYR